MSTVVISAYKVTNFTDGGGHFWVYMQYVQGLRLLGCEVYWLEQLRPVGDPEREAQLVSTFLDRAKLFGLEGRTLLYARDRDRKGEAGSIRFIGRTQSQAEAILRRADLVLNFHYAIDPRLLAWARRTALVDIDPGLLQFWMSTGQIHMAPHDRYLTISETIGTPAARVPDCGLRWIHTRPPVCLELWPFTYDPQAEAFTTVSTWSSTNWLKLTENGKTVLRENTKRVSFLQFVELPRHTRQPLELALYLVDDDAEDRARLEHHGWRVRDSREFAGSPEAYQSYVQRSRGEFSCAKPSYVEFQSAWISDRTLCYLASGKPAYLPHGEGMFRFTSLDEAAQALATINTDYKRHCRAAREIAETHFDSKRILESVLNAALSAGTGAAAPVAEATT